MTPSVPTASRSAAPATASVRTTSAEATRAFGAALARVARAGDRIALIGQLGAGKTQFAKGFAVGLGITEVVNSPSFTLMTEYRGRLPLFHQDLYRLAGAAEAIDSGLLDVRQDEGVTITEWGDRLDATLDAGRLEIRFTVLGDEDRELRLAADDAGRYRDYLAIAAADAAWDAPGSR